MRSLLLFRRCYTVLAIILLFAAVLHGQSVQGTLAGVVTDSSGAVIANANVSAVNTGTAIAYSTTTTSEGVFRFPQVALGHYNVTVSAPGFKNSVTEQVLVEIGTVASLKVACMSFPSARARHT